MRRPFYLLLAAAFVFGCQYDREPTAPATTDLAAQRVDAASVPSHAEVEFGADHVGSPFPPAQHDQSFHSFDKLRPQTVVIQRGGSVTYEVYPCHQPAVYSPGIGPDDIDADMIVPNTPGCPPQRIDDPDGRIALGPPQQPPSAEEMEWTTPPGTFDEPGRYLVICTTRVHFVEAKMYGWVIVM